VSKEISLSQVKERIERPQINRARVLSSDFLSDLKADNSFWNARGISDETLEVFGGGVCTGGRMSYRYIFPIFNRKFKLVGVSGRDILNRNSKRPKWKHIGDKYDWLYPSLLNKGIILSKKRVFLVESIGDMLALWDAGIKNVLVLFGLNVSSSMISLLLQLDPREVILSLNNDSNKNFAGNHAAQKASSKLLKHFDKNQVKIVFPSKNDFGDMSKEEIAHWEKDNFEE
jgi:DNA primase